jgi:hypothetical protein
MAIVSEVFGSSVGEVDVSVGMENRGAWLCCRWKYLRFISAGNVPQYLRWRRKMVPDIGCAFRYFVTYYRNKKPLWWQWLGGVGY